MLSCFLLYWRLFLLFSPLPLLMADKETELSEWKKRNSHTLFTSEQLHAVMSGASSVVSLWWRPSASRLPTEAELVFESLSVRLHSCLSCVNGLRSSACRPSANTLCSLAYRRTSVVDVKSSWLTFTFTRVLKDETELLLLHGQFFF